MLAGPSPTVRLEPVPLVGRDGDALGQGLGEFNGTQFLTGFGGRIDLGTLGSCCSLVEHVVVPGKIEGITAYRDVCFLTAVADNYIYYYITLMHSSEEPSGSSLDPNQEFEQALADAQLKLSAVRERYEQVRQGQGRQGALKRRLEELQQELREVSQQLEVLEVELESRLFSWMRLSEPFWQAVRFGGLGLVGGWILHWWIRR